MSWCVFSPHARHLTATPSGTHSSLYLTSELCIFRVGRGEVERDSSLRLWSAINHSPTTQTSPGKGAHDQDCRAHRCSISVSAAGAQQDIGVTQNSSAWDDESHRLLQNHHFLFHGATASSGPGSPHNRSYTIALRHTTLGRTALYKWSAPYRDLHLYLTTHNTHNRQRSPPPAGFEPAIPANDRQQTHAFGRGYVEARTDTTQQSGQTPDKKLEIKNITVYVSGYNETPDGRGR